MNITYQNNIIFNIFVSKKNNKRDKMYKIIAIRN